jgi:FeS assembly SUF system protein
MTDDLLKSLDTPPLSPTETVDKHELREKIIEALKSVYDPEIPVNIYDLGLIYNIDINDSAFVKIDMTLTAPGCPVAGTFPGEVESAVRMVEDVSDVVVELVWDPPWTKERMTEVAKLELGMF